MSDPQQGNEDRALTVILTALTAALLAEFMTAEVALIKRFAVLIAKYGVGDLLLHGMRKTAREAATNLQRSTPAMVERVIERAVQDGVKAAGPGEPVKPNFGIAGDTFESHAERSARAIREDLDNKLNGLGYRITRFADDAYRAVVADAAQTQVLGATPVQAQHEAYRRLMARGIDGFVDSKGRKWELSAYVEMATRTAAQRAFNVSHLDRMQALGITYFYVTDDGHPCPLCLPWQNEVLTVGIPDEVAAHTVEEATLAGLFHPRCRHTLVAFTPGVSKIPAPHKWNADDQRRYDESQMQRALERAIRAAKRQLDGAFTPEMKADANRRVRVAQKNMRDFIESTGRVRNTRREQLSLGNR